MSVKKSRAVENGLLALKGFWLDSGFNRTRRTLLMGCETVLRVTWWRLGSRASDAVNSVWVGLVFATLWIMILGRRAAYGLHLGTRGDRRRVRMIWGKSDSCHLAALTVRTLILKSGGAASVFVVRNCGRSIELYRKTRYIPLATSRVHTSMHLYFWDTSIGRS